MGARCRDEAEKEASGIVALREVLEKERRRRKRYEGYESAAAEVNRKKSRAECKAEIEATQAAIEDLKRQRNELDAKIEERSQRAQTAAAMLAVDLGTEVDADLRTEVDDSRVPRPAGAEL